MFPIEFMKMLFQKPNNKLASKIRKKKSKNGFKTCFQMYFNKKCSRKSINNNQNIKSVYLKRNQQINVLLSLSQNTINTYLKQEPTLKKVNFVVI